VITVNVIFIQLVISGEDKRNSFCTYVELMLSNTAVKIINLKCYELVMWHNHRGLGLLLITVDYNI
jgi:hypothetical protein